MTDTLYLNVSVYPWTLSDAATLYADVWLASDFMNAPSGSTGPPGPTPAGTTTVAVVFGGTACSIAGLDNTKSYWLRLFNPQGYSHWFPVGWQTGNSSGAPMVISVPAFEGPIISPPVSGAPASLSGTGLTTSPGDLLQAGGFVVDDAAGTGITLGTIGDLVISSYEKMTLSTTGSDDIALLSGGAVTITSGTKVMSLGVAIQTADAGFGNYRLGFFNTVPVDQPATPATLTDVINALIALGLVAP